MTDERRRILEMLAQGKITVQDADDLLRAVGADAGDRSSAG
ncbi:MAG: SHOCT-like domain-containing protein, partial [Vicinamibacterales bacterium]